MQNYKQKTLYIKQWSDAMERSEHGAEAMSNHLQIQKQIQGNDLGKIQGSGDLRW